MPTQTLEPRIESSLLYTRPDGTQAFVHDTYRDFFLAKWFADRINDGRLSVRDAYVKFWSYVEDAELWDLGELPPEKNRALLSQFRPILTNILIMLSMEKRDELLESLLQSDVAYRKMLESKHKQVGYDPFQFDVHFVKEVIDSYGGSWLYQIMPRLRSLRRFLNSGYFDPNLVKERQNVWASYSMQLGLRFPDSELPVRQDIPNYSFSGAALSTGTGLFPRPDDEYEARLERYVNDTQNPSHLRLAAIHELGYLSSSEHYLLSILTNQRSGFGDKFRSGAFYALMNCNLYNTNARSIHNLEAKKEKIRNLLGLLSQDSLYGNLFKKSMIQVLIEKHHADIISCGAYSR